MLIAFLVVFIPILVFLTWLNIERAKIRNIVISQWDAAISREYGTAVNVTFGPMGSYSGPDCLSLSEARERWISPEELVSVLRKTLLNAGDVQAAVTAIYSHGCTMEEWGELSVGSQIPGSGYQSPDGNWEEYEATYWVCKAPFLDRTLLNPDKLKEFFTQHVPNIPLQR